MRYRYHCYILLKRLFDIVFSILGMIVLFPLFFVMVLVIKLTSKGPVFYRGVRIGMNGKPFHIYKFRTMVQDAEKIGASSTSSNDPRLTIIGKFIRRFKLDEISQLINVLVGDMSIVGPRPEVQKFIDKYYEEEKKLLTIRPGITDWSSIKFHNEPELIVASGIVDADDAYEKIIRPDKIKLGLKYVKEHNLWIDIKIIFSTILTIVSTRFGGRVLGVPKDF